MNMFARLLAREFKHLAANPTQILNPIAFLFLAVMLFSIAVPVDARLSSGIAMLWVVVLLTNMLALDSMFRRELDNGVLEQVLVSANVPFLVVLAKIVAHWMHTGFVCVLLSPLLASILQLPSDAMGVLALSLAVGTPALTFLGAIGAALTVGFSRGGVVLALLVLPLFIPVLIFGTQATQEHLLGSSAGPQLYWLAFISMIAVTIGPFAALAGLRISVQLH